MDWNLLEKLGSHEKIKNGGVYMLLVTERKVDVSF